MIVISNPTPIPNEIPFVQHLFQQGLEKFHLRKPFFTLEDTVNWMEAIGLEHHSKIVLHQHFELAFCFEVRQIHLSEYKRENLDYSQYNRLDISTAVHNIKNFNRLDFPFCYAFLSPVFPSISKPEYQTSISWKEALQTRSNFTTKLIALGGIDVTKLSLIQEFGFDDYALLGCIWVQKNGFQNFKLCQQFDQLH